MKFSELYSLTTIFKQNVRIANPNMLSIQMKPIARHTEVNLESNPLAITHFFHLLAILKFFETFKDLVDIVPVDNITKALTIPSKNRFLVKYKLASKLHENTIDLNITWDTNKKMYSCRKLYANSTWLEREMWDLFGIFFYGSYDLRRLLTDYGFSGFPFRKDFPLGGFIELEYSEELQEIIYAPISLSQENRYFEYDSSWIS